MARSPIDPLRIIIIVALTLVAAVRVTYWLQATATPSYGTSFITSSPPLPPAPPGTAIVEGAVTDDAGASIGGARVTLYLGSNTMAWRKTTDSDAQGRFAFAEVPAGWLQLGADPQNLEYAYERWNSIQLKVGPHERLSHTFVITRLAAISGTVYGIDGKPASTGYVRTYSLDKNSLGEIEDFSAGKFTITKLLPGKYIVMSALGTSAREHFFHPATWRAANAKTISLKAGESRQDVDVHMANVPTSSISGTVVLSDGVPAVGVSVRLADADGVTDAEPRSTTTNSEGRFVFDDVPLDDYWVAASGKQQWVRQRIALERAGQSLQLRLEPGGRVRGRVVLPAMADARKPARLMAWLVVDDHLDRVWGREQFTTRGPVLPDGTFVMEDVAPGRYRLQIEASQPGGYLRVDAVRLPSGGIDAPLVVTTGADMSGITVEMTERGSDVAGTARRADGSPAGQMYIVTFPADPHVFPVPGFRVGFAHTQSNGAFNIFLRSGDYYIAAVPEREWTGRSDAEFLATLQPGATRVTITAGQTVKHDVTIR